MEQIIITAIDCYRHDYWKVSIQLLCDLKIISAISDFSFLGNSNTPLNEKGFAYLEIDKDCSIFDKAMTFHGKQYQIDFDTLQKEFDEKYQDFDEWLEQLDRWNTNKIKTYGFTWDPIPDELSAIITSKKSYDDEEEFYD